MRFSDPAVLVDWLRTNSFSTQRAVAKTAGGHLIAFGNDGGAKNGEFELYCAELWAQCARIIARGVNQNSYSWFVLFEGGVDALDECTNVLWQCWYKATQTDCPPPGFESMLRAQNGRVAESVSDIEWTV